MRVYRFMSLANGLDSIQARRLRIGRLVELNDPYDCAPGIAHAPNIPPGGEEAFEAGLFCPVSGSVWVLELQCHGFRSPHLDSLRRRPSRHCTWFRLHRSGRWPYPGRIRRGTSHSQLWGVGANPKRERCWGAASRHHLRVHQEGIKLELRTRVSAVHHLKFLHTSLREHYFRPIPSERLFSVVLGARCPIRPVDVSRSLHAAGYPDPNIVSCATKHRGHYEMVVA